MVVLDDRIKGKNRNKRELGSVIWAILDDLRTFIYDNLMLERIQDVIGSGSCALV